MSNIPFNTISSILASTGVSQQVAAARSKETQETARAQRLQQIKAERHAEEVEDLDETAVDAVHDQPRHKNSSDDQDPQKNDSDSHHPPENSAEQIDIEALKGMPVSPAKKTITPTARRLDISA